ncbi:hypothetical protein N9T65_00235 [Candidatus Pelagibacter sp.]|nr:hypothetical protein [Candidatus Pelagibacter sp.]MDA9663288.1 hypothetical protein [Candidatus Pelagibacter sp.]
MKILKLLNNKNFTILLVFMTLSINSSYANDPVDIWSTKNNDKKKLSADDSPNKKIQINSNSVYEMQTIINTNISIEENQNNSIDDIKIFGLYDPSNNDLSIDMWNYSDGKKILDILNKINKIKLSKDAKEILNIALLTNSYSPKQNINDKIFLNLKNKWLIKQGNLKLIEEFLVNNNDLPEKSTLLKYYLEEYLSRGDLINSCKILERVTLINPDDYISKFRIYCLINNQKKDEAQLQLDLLKEIGFEDNFFEKKFNYFMGYEDAPDKSLSIKTILDFHLSHRSNPEFKFEPNDKSTKLIWRYMSSFNLLASIDTIDIEDINKIKIIEKAAHDKNYSEKDLFDLYKRFMFSINQLLTVDQSYKLLDNVEARALVYQGILITNSVDKKLELIKTLKELFIEDNISNAFDQELKSFLFKIGKDEVPSNYSTFYENYTSTDNAKMTKIKFNNKIIHQSKLLNYFIEENRNIKSFQKDFDKILKKIKKNKDYSISTKDIILIESLKSDGIVVSKKYDNWYADDKSNIPSDIQILINNDETGMLLLRLVEIIGQDMIEDIGSETLHFIVNALNELNIDKLRNKILLKILPLKV